MHSAGRRHLGFGGIKIVDASQCSVVPDIAWSKTAQILLTPTLYSVTKVLSNRLERERYTCIYYIIGRTKHIRHTQVEFGHRRAAYQQGAHNS